MLLWIRNLKFRGSNPVFFISGQIVLQFEADIIAQHEATLTLPGEADVIIQNDGNVSA